jgi:hypothetical protein
MNSPTVYESELFPIILKLLGSEPHARVATYIIFWFQLAKHRRKGRVGLYKTDQELETDTGKRSAGRLLLHLACASAVPAPKPKPIRLRQTKPLFEIDYGPKPGQGSGRVRWIYLTEVSLKIIDEALEAREEKSSSGKAKPHLPVAMKCSDQSSKKSAIPIDQTDTSYIPTNSLSGSKAKENALGSKEVLGTINRVFQAWNTSCTKSGKSQLKWSDLDQKRFLPELSHLVDVLQIDKLSDQVLEARMTVLCTRLNSVMYDMSDSFQAYNTNGLIAQSFAKYGQQLLIDAEKLLSKKDPWKGGLKASDPLKIKTPGPTSPDGH